MTRPPLKIIRRTIASTIPHADELHSIFYLELESLLIWAVRNNIPYRITDTKRNYETQQKAYDNWLKTGENLNGQKVAVIAHPDKAKHVIGKAADIDAPEHELEKLGAEWQRRGHIWGGRWKAREIWHFEIH